MCTFGVMINVMRGVQYLSKTVAKSKIWQRQYISEILSRKS